MLVKNILFLYMNVKQPTGVSGMAKYELPELGVRLLRRRFQREHNTSSLRHRHPSTVL